MLSKFNIYVCMRMCTAGYTICQVKFYTPQSFLFSDPMASQELSMFDWLWFIKFYKYDYSILPLQCTEITDVTSTKITDITIYKIDVHKVKWTTIRINMFNMMIKIATSSDLLLFCYYTMPREQNHLSWWSMYTECMIQK